MDEYMLIDIETPYSFEVEDGIREVAAIVVRNNDIIDQLHLAVITDEDEYKKGYGSGLEAIEENQEFKTRFQEFIKKHDCPIIAHYAPFERRFLTHWKWIDQGQTLYCSLRAIKKQVPGLPWYSLNELMNAYGFKKEQEHTALQDIIDLLELLKIINPTEWLQVGERSAYDPDYEKQLREERKQRLERAKSNQLCNLFNGKKIVFTGKMAGSRTDMMELAIKYGATTANSVSIKTDLLVVGEDAGSKLQKAQEMGVKIVSETEFWNLINSAF